VHAQHHQLYVTYAYGAVYAHWLESLFLDIVSFLLANAIAGFSPRQSMLFGSLATIKTISDHCGYVFPGDPFNYMNSNGARFHDLHHQAWGLKVRSCHCPCLSLFASSLLTSHAAV
jgi:sphinganine C4-monooxygenase